MIRRQFTTGDSLVIAIMTISKTVATNTVERQGIIKLRYAMGLHKGEDRGEK